MEWVGRRQLMSSLFNIITIVHRASRSNNLQLYLNRSTLTVDSKHNEKFLKERTIFRGLNKPSTAIEPNECCIFGPVTAVLDELNFLRSFDCRF